MLRKKGFQPLVDQKTEILILGSFPSNKSLEKGQYYANPQNHFWKIISRILNEDLTSLDHNKRKEKLLKNRIGIWDVIESHEGFSSKDEDIVNEKFNDFKKLDLPNLKKVFFNGSKAFGHNKLVNFKVQMTKLPSSSPRVPFKSKIDAWIGAFRN